MKDYDHKEIEVKWPSSAKATDGQAEARAYDHRAIETKWQEKWSKEGLYKAGEKGDKPKAYVLDMFPYPSGSGLHVGHVEGYTATDIYARYQRMQGFEVLHPMGWDAFGLPAENYAIKTGTPPQSTTDAAIATFTKQIKSLGLSYDWSREIGTHTPEYYRWTQWFFLFLYKQGLAEKRMANVNWCPKDQTVLANEQVVNGTCERCGTAVVQKDLEQWFFKTTAFADALHNDLDQVDWPESTKTAQRNWIGRSEGAEIEFPISNSQLSITVFTTRADTLYGATYLVLAPEHSMLGAMIYHNTREVAEYVTRARNKTNLERTEMKEKTGVELKGVKAINPATKEEIPIWVADFVIGSYGTGAVMAVPDIDERDNAFAKAMGIPIGETKLVDATEAIQKVGGRIVTKYKLRDWLVSRQRYWGAPIPMVYDPSGQPHPVPEEHLPWLLPTDVEFKPTGVSPLGQSKELLVRTEKIFGKGWKPEIDTLDTFVCSSWYFFRFTDPHNQDAFASPDAMKRWLPVDLYMGGAEHTVLHLMYARFFTKALKKAGLISFGEPFMKLRHQGTILAEDGSKMSKSKGNVVNPDDVISTFGADSLRIYEMFMGPLEAMKPWNTQNIMGARRFIERVWRLAGKISDSKDGPTELDTILQQTIRKVGDDVQSFSLNTAISQMMIFVNAAEKSGVGKAQFKTFLKLLAPFAPHVTEELWEKLGHATSLHEESWPSYDAAKTVSETVTIAVQVAGKTRGTIVVNRGASEVEVLSAVQGNSNLSKYIDFKPQKVIYIPERVLNLVPE